MNRHTVVIFPISRLEEIAAVGYAELPRDGRIFTYHDSIVYTQEHPLCLCITTFPETRVYAAPKLVYAGYGRLLFSGIYSATPSGMLAHLEEHLIILSHPDHP